MDKSTDPLDQFLSDAAKKLTGDEVSLSIRELIGKWNAKRRGYWQVRQIRDDLRDYGLMTVPSFETGWIDSPVRLVPIRTASSVALPQPVTTDVASADQGTTTTVTGLALKVNSLRSASEGVQWIRPSDSLERAESLMMQNDFSQLPVMANEREVLGVVSWESIAQNRMHRLDCGLRHCIVPVDTVGIEDDLLPHVPKIIDAGQVLVRGKDRKVSGIVTTSDISATFLSLAGPFLLIGEVERRLRQIVTLHYTLEEIRAAKDARDESRQVESVEDLSLGETIRMFQSKERWALLNWQIDRAVFCAALEKVKALRNDIMHFTPDPIDDVSLAEARNLLKWLSLMI